MVSAPHKETVTTTVSRIVDWAPQRTAVTIYNNSDNTIYIGSDEETTTSNGLPVPAGMAIVFTREFGDEPTLARYAVAETGTNDVRILEEYGVSLTTVLEELITALRGKG